METADSIARRVLNAHDDGASIDRISDSIPGFDLAAAYAVSRAVVAERVARGERPVGWKIGFTNRTIWDEYGVHAPIWGPMYTSTVHEIPFNRVAACSLHGLVEPRIEPEIAFRVARPPEPHLEGMALLACLDGVAHGF